MAREQIQVPFDTNSSSDRDQGAGVTTKGLNRPALPSTLQKPKLEAKLEHYKATLYRKCNCGNQYCYSPADPNNRWYWEYFDANTHKKVNDPDLPRKGGRPGSGWTHK